MPLAPSTHDAPFRLERDACRDLPRALTHEWLETDGLGGYASSTVLNCATRRYHGLLVTRPPGAAQRHVFLARFDELVRTTTEELPCSMARYADLFAPRGDAAVESFELASWPCARYRWGDVELTREVLMTRAGVDASAGGAVLCRYVVNGAPAGSTLELRALLPFREAGALTVENEALDATVEVLPNGIRARPYPTLPAIAITLDASHGFHPDPTWYRGVVFPEDRRRGYFGGEDQFSPGVLSIPLAERTEVVLAATIGAPVARPAQLWRDEADRRVRAAQQHTPLARARRAADAYLYRDSAGRLGVDAGYPWFGEWGRDTFIALPGLTLARGELEACGEALSGARAHLRDGLVPNVFGPTPAESHYNSADAALWFARAVRLYEQAGGDEARLRDELMPALEEIADAYYTGTGLGIHGDDEGLVHVGAPDLNPTWMDAQTSAGPVTPRHGFPVEIEALWYSLLHHLVEWHARSGDAVRRERWSKLRRRARRAFLERFWLADVERLADGWRDGRADRALRPNMVLAAALEWSPLSRAQRAGVVTAARAELLTPYGLRTLAPSDPAYVGRYEGGGEERDAAYHQGTVWPWLLGSYCEAALRAFGAKRSLVSALRHLWDALEEHLDEAGIDHLSEVFDGDAPQRPGGTIAQAWSLAEYLRAAAMLERREP